MEEQRGACEERARANASQQLTSSGLCRPILTPAELQAARRLHCYPASSAQHGQGLLAAGLRLRVHQLGDAERD